MTMYSRLMAVLCLSVTFLSQNPASAQSNPTGVLFTVMGNNALPVERADIKMTDSHGVVMLLRTDGYGNAAETLTVAISNPYRISVTKRAWSLTSNRWITDSTTYQTVLSPDSAATGGLQRLAASLTRTPGSDPKRVSILFVHYSNGDIALQGTCWNSDYNRNIFYYLDTLKVLAGSDTGKIAFRSYQMNADAGNLGGAALSTARPGSGENGCSFDRFPNSSYGWGSDFNRMSIWCHMNDGPNNSEYDIAGLLNRFFFRPHKEDSAFWAPFRTTRLPDNTLEVDGFDLVCIKQPQRSYGRMNVAKRDSIKVLYSIVYDSMAAHTETNWCLVFGFPYAYDAYKNDAASAALVGQLLHWFNDTLPDPNVRNVWTFDSYSAVDDNAYLMDLQYTNPEDRDHLHFTTGGTAVQSVLIPKLRSMAQEILASRRTSPTPPPTVNPPVANFSGNPTSGTAPLSVTFADLSTNNPTTWDWNWGDGTAHGTTRNPSHTYTAAGTYTVSLTVSNSGGSDIEVKNGYIVAGQPPQNPPTAAFYGSPTVIDSGGTVSFFDQSTNNPTSWIWNFGDNTTTATGQNPVHQYNRVGTFSVVLRAANAYGFDDTVRSDYVTVRSLQSGPVTYAVFGGGVNDARDTYITRYAPGSNFSTTASHIIFNRSVGEFRLLLRWSQIDPVIAGATIDSAKLWFFPSGVERGPDTLLAVHRVLRNWEPTQATWNSSATGISWSAAGLAAGGDYLATATDTASGMRYRTLFSFDVTNDLRAWAGGSQANSGWVIKGAGSAYTQFVLYSADQVWTLPLRPKLEIWYHGGSGTLASSEATASLVPAVDPTALSRAGRDSLSVADLNGSTSVDISDLTLMIGYLFSVSHPSLPPTTGDLDCDGRVQLSDLTFLIQYLFRGGANPCTP